MGSIPIVHPNGQVTELAYALLVNNANLINKCVYRLRNILMKRIAEPIDTTELCSYGCGFMARFKNGSGNLMCSERHNSCPVNRKKNSAGLLASGRNYAEHYDNLPQEIKDRMAWSRGKRFAVFGYGTKGQFKSALIAERGHRCESCNNESWLGKPITLELEHCDGDRKNNTRENLKLLCPNCHSQTATWRRGKTPGLKMKKYSDQEIIAVIESSENLNQVLEKLDLRYGSAKTIIDVMSRHNVKYMGV